MKVRSHSILDFRLRRERSVLRQRSGTIERFWILDFGKAAQSSPYSP